MDILLVTPEYPPYGSGIANVVCTLRDHMLKKNVNVNVLTRGGGDINTTSSFDILPGIAGLVPFWQKVANHVAKRGNNYDVVWLHSPLLISASKLRYAKKLMVSFHSTYYGFYQAYKTHAISHLLPYYYFATKLEHHLLNQLSHNDEVIITATSPSVAEELQQNGLSLFPHIITQGLEIKHHTSDKYRSREFLQRRHSLYFSEDDLILLYIGRITEVKQTLLLIDLFKVINSFEPNIHLVMVGSGNLFKKLKKKATRLSNIHMLGHISHKSLSLFLDAADAFISLSCYESAPLSVLEAASFNLPLILSNIPAHRYIVKSKIVPSVLVSSHDPSVLDIMSFLKSKVKKSTIKSRYNNYYFTWDDVVAQYLKLASS